VNQAIAAVSFSGQMMGCVPVDRAGTPLRSCIIWADQRAQTEAAGIGDVYDAALLYQRSGHRISPAYCAAKLLWLRTHQPQIFQAAAYFLLPKDSIVQRLTGAFVTDYSDASGTLLFDLKRRAWNEELLQALALSPATLPALHPSTAVVGQVTQTAAKATGLAPGTPVVLGGGDGACAGVGAGVVEPGQAYCYIGSSAWISISSAQPVLDPQQRTFTFHHLHPQRYCPMGTMQAAGGARDWAWQQLAEAGLDLDQAAATVPPGAGGLIFLPYLLGERSPHWNPLARGAFVGLAMPHSRASMARAVLEGVALNLRAILNTLRAQVPGIDAIRLIGGGSQSVLWRQILADCFDLPIQVLALQGEATSWGAAVAGGVGVGLFDWPLAAERATVVQIVLPDQTGVAVYAELAGIYQDTYTALAPIYARLAQMQSKTA
ncbi:MAG: FGGY family carbohydrate kinase, partial [Chloroflexota bacterium]|nr:FGGY family carbohydrate kinase [Chloroflexota bacterium]